MDQVVFCCAGNQVKNFLKVLALFLGVLVNQVKSKWKVFDKHSIFGEAGVAWLFFWIVEFNRQPKFHSLL